MTGGAEGSVVDLILHQQIGLCRCVRLVARQAIDLCSDLRNIRGIEHIRNRMALNRMPPSIFQWQHDDFVLREIVFGKLDAAIEDGNQMLSFQLLGLQIGPVTLQTKRIWLFGP